jgi:hypothetical protein
LTGDLKLYAQWETSVGAVEADNVVVTYYGNGAKTADGSTKFTDAVADEAVSYTFLENPFYSGNGVVYLSDNKDYIKTDSKTVATYMGWSGQSADTILKSTAKIYRPKTAITRKLLLNSSFRISESNGAVLVPVYAIWDYYPTVTASDLVLELSEAEEGMSAATLMERIGAKASDREDGDSIINQSSRLKLLDYDPSVLTSLQVGESMTVTLSATDTAGNETRKTVCISVKDPNAMEVIYRCMSYERFGAENASSSITTMRYMSHSTNKRFSEVKILVNTTVLYMQNAAVTYPKLYDASGNRVSVQQNVTTGSGFVENPFRYDENGNMCLKDPEEYVNSGNNFVYSTLNNTTARYRQFSSYTSSSNLITNSYGTTMGSVSYYDNAYRKSVYASGANIRSSIYSGDLFTKKNSYLYKSGKSVSSGSGPSFLSLVDENIKLCVIDVYPDMFPVMKAPETITLDADTSYYERYASGPYGQMAAGYSKLKNKTESGFLDFLHVQVLQTIYAQTQYTQDTTNAYYYSYRDSYYDPDGGTCTITEEVLPDWDKLYAALNGENNFSFDYTVEVTDDEGNRCRTTYPFRVTCSKTTTSPTTSTTPGTTTDTTETPEETPQYPDLVEKEYEICYHGNGAVTKYSEDSYVQGGYLSGDTDIVLAENRFVNEKINGTKTTFFGWSVSETATAAANADKIWKTGTVFSAADLFSGSYTLTDGVRLDLYAVWDEYPNLSAEDIFLTTQQAKSGLTAQRLLSLCSAAATDKEDDNKTLTGQITICEEDIQASLWNADAGSVIPMTLRVTDSAGNMAEKKVKIYIYDLTLEIITRDSYVRFISPAYYKCEQEKGGLSGQSVWRQREPYASLLEETMGKVTAVLNEDAHSDHSTYAVISKVFTSEDVVQMKEDLEN